VGKTSGSFDKQQAQVQVLMCSRTHELETQSQVFISNAAFKDMHKSVNEMQGHHKPANYDGSLPARHQPRYIVHHNRFSEDCAIQDVSDGAIWTPPHLF